MKTNLTFRSSLLVLLTVVLLLSSPLATLAQQISAEAQAKRDAEADLNKRFWINTGCAVVLLPTLGLFVGSLGPQSYSGGSSLISPSNQQSLGLCVGSILALGPLALIRRHQPTPPPERFIGKSPAYIDVYTDVYKTRTQFLSRQYRVVGCAIGCAIGGGLAILYENLE